MIVSIFAPHTMTRGERAGEIVPGYVPERWKTTWPEFVGTMEETAAVPADPADKLRVLAVTCADFVAGTNRGKANVIGCDWIGFDFDNKTGSTDAWMFDDLVAFVEPLAVPFLVYTTASCREEAQCLRLMMPLDRGVGSDEFPLVWRSFNHWLRSRADEATKDASRLYFEPRLWTGRYNRFHDGHADQPPICVDMMVKRCGPVENSFQRPVAPAYPLDASPWDVRNQDRGDIADLASPIISAKSLHDAMVARQGGRMYRFLCSAACSAKRQRILLSEGDLSEIGNRLAQRLGRRDRSDIRHDARNAMNFAATTCTDGGASQHPGRAMLPRHW